VTASPTDPAAAGPTVSLGDRTVAPGDSLTLTAAGFLGGERVSIELHSDPVTLALSSANGTGDLLATVTIPLDTTPGEHAIVLRGLESGRTVSADITVTRPVTGTGTGTGTGQPLAATGVGLPIGLIALGGLIAIGGGLVITRTVSRNRKAV
jgi:hypothetical protein